MPIRRVVSKALTTKVVEKLKPVLVRTANELIDGFIEKGNADLLMDYSYPLTTIATCELLGIPKKDYHLFLADNRSSNRTYEGKTFTEEDLKNDNEEIKFLSNYFSNMCEDRKANPQDDLVSALLTANQEEKNVVTDEYMVSNIFLLFGAGYENTSNTITTLLYYLFKNPSQLTLLQSNYAGMIHAAVEEAVRYEPPLQISSPMVVTNDIEISGVQIQKGDVLLAHMGSASHDPKIFVDPEKFDIRRENTTSVHFGTGIHTCLGIHLGKVKAEIAIETLFKRIPRLNLANIDNPKWRPQASIRGLASLQAYW
jgi:cytochrome P450